jgi:lipopolysaccharide export system permease protein
LVTIGVLTKNNELVVMKACGISLYRIALPMVVCAIAAGLLLFGLEETILGPSNRRAGRLNDAIRGRATSSDAINRQWVVGARGETITTTSSIRRPAASSVLSVYEFPDGMERILAPPYAEPGLRGPRRHRRCGTRAGLDSWRSRTPARRARSGAFEKTDRTLDALSTFATEAPDARFMGYRQLRDYTERLRASGFDVLDQDVRWRASWPSRSSPSS